MGWHGSVSVLEPPLEDWEDWRGLVQSIDGGVTRPGLLRKKGACRIPTYRFGTEGRLLVPQGFIRLHLFRDPMLWVAGGAR